MPTCLTKCQLRYTKVLPVIIFGLIKLRISELCPFTMLLSLSRLHYPCSLIRRFLCDDVSVIFWDFMRRYRPNTLCWAASSLLRLRRVQLVKNFSCSLWLLVQWSYSSALIQTLTLAWIHENVYSELSVGSYLHHFILSSPV